MENDTQSEFLKDLEPVETDPFAQEVAAEVVEPEKEDDEEAGNRRERRLQAKLQAERESSIALAAKLEVLTEAQKFSRAENVEVDETIARIYGTNTPEAAEATALLQKALLNVENRATAKALETFREEQRTAQAEVASQEKALETMVDEIEDQYRTTLDDPTRKAFFTLLERMSPKDANGEVKEYADHNAVWEELQARRQVQPNRARELAARSMTKTGASPAGTVEQGATERFLKEQGII